MSILNERPNKKRFPYMSPNQPSMTPKERVIRALRRKGPDKVPTCARFTPWMMRTFNEKVGAGIPDEHLGNFSVGSGFIHEVRPSFLTPDDYFGWEIRHVSFRAPGDAADFSAYHATIPPGAKLNEWGVLFVPGTHHHYTRRVSPLRDMNRIDELRAYPFPDLMQPECHDDLDRMVALIHEDGFAAAGFLQQTLFELAWEMRGMERLLMDFMINKPFARYLLDKITEIRCAMAARYAEAGVDIIRLGDDLGTQRSLIMSPKLCKETIFPRLKRIINSARQVNPEVIIFFHSDGSIGPIIGEFIDIGVDVLNPLQPECLDIAAVKKEFGDRLSFWGGVGIQTTMPYGSPAEVKETVKKTIEIVGEGGGLLIAPSHALQPDVPWENVIAFFEAVDEFGWY